jgi:hypothetical protein
MNLMRAEKLEEIEGLKRRKGIERNEERNVVI